MTTAVLTDGIQYFIPSSDIAFFKAIATKMGWIATRVGDAAAATDDVEVPLETKGKEYTLSSLKARFTPMYSDKNRLRDDYLSDN